MSEYSRPSPGDEKFAIFLEVINELIVSVQALTEQVAISNHLAAEKQPQEQAIDLSFVVDLFNEFKKRRKGR